MGFTQRRSFAATVPRIGIEYFLQDARRTVYFDSDRPEFPVRLRGGAIGFYTRSRTYYAHGNVPSWGAKFAESGWAPLDEIKTGKWDWLEPRPVRILAARLIQVNEWQAPCYFALNPGEFIQGLLAHISPHHKRLYAVPLPAEQRASGGSGRG